MFPSYTDTQENMWARLRDSRPWCVLDSRNLAHVLACISVFAHYVSSFSLFQMKAVDFLQHSLLTLKSPLAHAYHESHKRSGALKTGIRCCERLSPSLLQPLPSSLQSPLDFEAGRSIEERERGIEQGQGREEPWEGGSRHGRDTFSIMTLLFCLR